MSTDKTTGGDGEPKENPLLPSPLGDALPESYPYEGGQNSERKENPSSESGRRWWNLSRQEFFSLVLIVVYGFQAHLAHFMQGQLDVMNAQLSEMRSSSTQTNNLVEATQVK